MWGLVFLFNPLTGLRAYSKDQNSERLVLQLKWKHQFQFAGYYAAIEKGFYKEAGLEVILKEGKPGMSFADEVVSGNADYGIDMPILLLERYKGKPVVVLAAILQHSPEIIIVRKDSGIISPHDLLGKRIMLCPKGNIESLAMFRNEGLALEQLQFVDHSWDIDDLIEKNVDAATGYLTDRPFMLQNRGVPYNIIHPLTYGVDFYGDCLFTSEKEIKDHPKRVKSFRDASLQGWDYAMRYPEEIAELILKKYHSKLSRDALLFEANAMQELMQPKFIQIGHMNPDRWKHIADTFVKFNMLLPEYSLKEFLYDPNHLPHYDRLIKAVWILSSVVLFIMIFTVFLLFFNRKLNKLVMERTEHLYRENTDRRWSEEVNKVLFSVLNAVNTTQNLKDLFASIHHSLGSILDVTNFFIAMVDIKKRTLYFPYHVDTTDDDFSPITNFDTNDSLTGLVVSQRRPVLLKKKDLEKRTSQNGVWGPVPLIWMGAPLIVKEEVIGVVAVQSYLNPNLYTEQDLRVLSVASDQMAIAIDRKRSDDAVWESEKKYRHLFQNAPAGIYEIDFEKIRFIAVNDIMCRYTGYSKKEFLSMNPLDLLTKESKDLYIERLGKFLTEKKLPGNVEYTIIKKNGQKLCVILNSDFICKNGKVTGARVVTHDISKLKQAEKEKIKAQKIAGEHEKLALVGQVAGKIAHDFNNILGIIMGNAELSLMDCKDKETKKTLELIFEQTIQGKNLTRNLVAFAKDQEPKQGFFRINEKIDLVINLLKKDLKGIELIREDKSGVPDLLADAGMIEHVLINLIQNSIHATSMSEHPRIIIQTYCLEGNICFEIEDNGCGIAKEHFASIYDPSFTLKGTKDIVGSYGSEISGTGYGMANVKKYIEQHKGNISIESKVNSGTKFTISLPVIKKELTSEEKINIREELSHFEKYILLVEDETAISNVQYRILTQEPCSHKVDTAFNGQVAMDLFDRNPYDFISLDYILPGNINGMDVYNHIRATNKTIPILFISGNIEFLESIKNLKQKDTNVDHLSKPCRNKDYIRSINKLLGKGLGNDNPLIFPSPVP
jgi:PAS domain S-box-containing protein